MSEHEKTREWLEREASDPQSKIIGRWIEQPGVLDAVVIVLTAYAVRVSQEQRELDARIADKYKEVCAVLIAEAIRRGGHHG